MATSLLPIFPGNASLQYLVDLLGFADDGVATVLDNFSAGSSTNLYSESDNSAASRLTCLCCGAVRPALFCGMVCGVLNELAWKVSAWRKLKAFAALPPAERAAAIARYDFCERQPSSLRHAQLRCSWCALAAAAIAMMTGAQHRDSR